MKYRKKPIVVEAYQTDKEIIIHTLEGNMKANVGDYIITGVQSEQYPCKPDIFEQTYEMVMPDKLTDNEIVKALEICLTKRTCEGCPLQSQYATGACRYEASKNALDLINRLQEQKQNLEIELQAMRNAANGFKAENERLKENLNIELENFATEYDNKIKAEAYKEFAELVKDKAYTYSDITGYQSTVVDVCEIDGVYEELVGDSNVKTYF